jgi:hypothetical protein
MLLNELPDHHGFMSEGGHTALKNRVNLKKASLMTNTPVIFNA